MYRQSLVNPTKKLPPQLRRKPSQARSKLLVDAIVQSCHKILMDKGVQQLTTNRMQKLPA